MNRIGRCGGRERAGEKRGDGRWGARERTRDGKTRVFFDLGAVSFFPEVAPRFSFFFSFFIFAGAGFVVGKGELKWFRSDDAVEVDEGPAVAAPSSPLLLSASTSSRASFFRPSFYLLVACRKTRVVAVSLFFYHRRSIKILLRRSRGPEAGKKERGRDEKVAKFCFFRSDGPLSSQAKKSGKKKLKPRAEETIFLHFSSLRLAAVWARPHAFLHNFPSYNTFGSLI